MTIFAGILVGLALAMGAPVDQVESVGTTLTGVAVRVEPVCSEAGLAPGQGPELCVEWGGR